METGWASLGTEYGRHTPRLGAAACLGDSAHCSGGWGCEWVLSPGSNRVGAQLRPRQSPAQVRHLRKGPPVLVAVQAGSRLVGKAGGW